MEYLILFVSVVFVVFVLVLLASYFVPQPPTPEEQSVFHTNYDKEYKQNKSK